MLGGVPRHTGLRDLVASALAANAHDGERTARLRKALLQSLKQAEHGSEAAQPNATVFESIDMKHVMLLYVSEALARARALGA